MWTPTRREEKKKTVKRKKPHVLLPLCVWQAAMCYERSRSLPVVFEMGVTAVLKDYCLRMESGKDEGSRM